MCTFQNRGYGGYALYNRGCTHFVIGDAHYVIRGIPCVIESTRFKVGDTHLMEVHTVHG